MPDFFEGPPPPPGALQPMQMPAARPQWQRANVGGITVPNTAVDQNQPLAMDQELAHTSTDMEMRLNDLDKAIKAHKARGEQTSGFDKALGIGMGIYYGVDPRNKELAEKANIIREHRGYGGGITRDRDQVFINADSTRQSIQQWIINASKSRNWKAVSNIETHFPFATDTEEMLEEKIEWWRNRLAEVRGQLGGRNIPVQRPGGYEPPATPPGGGTSAAPPAPPTSTPPFRVKSSRMLGDTRLYEDDKGGTWYLDEGKWVKYGS